MSWAIKLALVLLLSGCGSSSGGDEKCMGRGVHSTASTMVGDSGLMLEPSSNMFVTFEEIERFYLQTEACMGVLAPGPTVVFESFNGPMGVISVGTGIIRVNTNERLWHRNCESDESVLRHEFVHYLLHADGFPLEDNKAHRSPFFGECD